MGGVSTKEEIIARLDELDKKEYELNVQLRDLQLKLNELVPDEDKIKVNEKLGKMGEYPEIGMEEEEEEEDETNEEEEEEESEEDDKKKKKKKGNKKNNKKSNKKKTKK